MNSLKHDLRKMFDEKNPACGSSYYNEIEDGLLKKIINLSILNPSVFSQHACSVVAVKSHEAKQKLYRLSNGMQKILDAAAVLIITSDPAYTGQVSERGISSVADLLSVSVMYSAKFFDIDTCNISIEDEKNLRRVFGISENQKIVTIICLGCFYDTGSAALQLPKSAYSMMVKEI